MIVVMQCASRKRPAAGCLTTSSGKAVEFVAQPDQAPARADCIYARPDDPAEDGKTWRQVLIEYNRAPGDNPQRLLPACQLYDVDVYPRLAERFGRSNLYILSAGWGLIAADFLTPHYDITFSKAQNVPAFKRRGKSDRYNDFQMIPAETDQEIVFLGGKDYLPLFSELTRSVRGRKTVFYNSSIAPRLSGCALRLFETTTRTNWHYECANAILAGVVRF